MATQADVAAHLGVSQPAVSQMVKAEILPQREGRAGLDIDACRLAYLHHLREVAAGRASQERGDGLDLVAQRARLAKEQADAQAMKNDLLRGELLPVAEIEQAVGADYTRVRTRLLAIPSLVAQRVAGMTKPAEVQVALDSAIYDALAELTADAAGRAAGTPAGGGQ